MHFAHIMIRVFDLEKSLEFYQNHLSMNLINKNDYPEGRFTLAFLGYGDKKDHTVIELTHNWDQTEAYDQGNGFGHLAIAVDDVYKTCEDLEKKGVEITRPAGPMKGGTAVIAFVKDPDGYLIEFIEKS